MNKLERQQARLNGILANPNLKPTAVVLEGRDTAGKSSTIRELTHYMPTDSYSVVLSTKPTSKIMKGWLKFWETKLPKRPMITFFDRSWYNRAVVEPVMGFCSDKEYNDFLVQVPEFEHMLYEDGLIIIKFWLSISKEEQLKRFNARNNNPLKRWKFSPVDKKGQELWDTYTHYKDEMYSKTHTTYCPWMIIKTNHKKTARLEAMRYVLSRFDYDGKKEAPTLLTPDPNVVTRYYRSNFQID